ncbi:MAG: hypothetical protein LC747_00675 [Acidobacteria bacterium]|nr:hypothetical protein [Acidobacteriota bacterium]
MSSEQEGRAEVTEATDAASSAQAEEAAATVGAEEEVAATGGATTALATAPTATEAGDAEPTLENTRITDSLEAIKTAVVWLVVINILTVLSPLLRLSLKWTVVVGLILTVSSFTIGGVAYLKARRTP